MTDIVSLFYSLLPIIFGIGFLLFAQSLNIVTQKIEIDTSAPIDANTIFEHESIGLENNPVRDLLIINGKLLKGCVITPEYALRTGGIATYKSLKLLKTEIGTRPPGKLTIVISNTKILLREEAFFGRTTGLLLSYSLSGDLEVIKNGNNN